MSNKPISALPFISEPVVAGDFVPFFDTSETVAANKTKRAAVSELITGLPAATSGAAGLLTSANKLKLDAVTFAPASSLAVSGTVTLSGVNTGDQTDITGNAATATLAANSSQLLGLTWAVPGTIGSTTPTSGKFTTLQASGAITSTLATGTAPFTVASTTNVANLNASSLNGATFAAPGAIGSGTASTGAFTNLSSSGTVSGTGFAAYLASPPTIGSGTPAAGTFTNLYATNASLGNSAGSSLNTIYSTGTGTYAQLAIVNNSSGAQLNAQVWGSTYGGTWAGVSGNNLASITTSAGTASGLLISTMSNIPVVFGVNNAEIARCTSAGMTLSGLTSFTDGSVSAPSITFTNDQNTGIMRYGADQIALVAGGAAQVVTGTNYSTFIGSGGLLVRKSGATSSGGYIGMSGYDSGGATRDWGIRDDSAVDRLRFSRGSTDYAFWDVLKVAASDNVSYQKWTATTQMDWTIGATQVASITSGGISTSANILGTAASQTLIYNTNTNQGVTVSGGTSATNGRVQIFGGSHASFPGQVYIDASSLISRQLSGTTIFVSDSTGLAVTGNVSATGSVTGSVTATGSSTGRTLANRAAEVINVKDYGATGNGSTDDLSAINAAIAAVTDHSTLYFPAGTYKITNSLNGLSSKVNVTICGDGRSSEIYNSAANSYNTMVINPTCSHVSIHDLAFTGNASTRNGATVALRLYSNYSAVYNCFFSGCSNFAIHVHNDSGSTWNYGTSVTGNTIYAPYGDGIHVGAAADVVVANNVIISSGDDGIGIIADDINHTPNRVTVIGNDIYNAGATSVSGCGIRISEVSDVTVAYNNINTTFETGIRINRYTSTSAYNNRVSVVGNNLVNCAGNAGSNSIDLHFGFMVNIAGNTIADGVNGVGIMVIDVQDCTIQENIFRHIPSGGIRTDPSATSNVANTWDGLVIKNNSFLWIVANDAIYAVPAAGKSLNNLVIDGNHCKYAASGSFIYYDRVAGAKVVNNTGFNTATIAAGGTVSGVTTANNN